MMFCPEFKEAMDKVDGWPIRAAMDVLSAKFRELGLDKESTETGGILIQNIQRRPSSRAQYLSGLLDGFKQRRERGGRLDRSELKIERAAWLELNNRRGTDGKNKNN